MSMDKPLVYAPDGPTGSDSPALASPAARLKGTRVAVLDNGKPNAARLMSMAAERFARRVGAQFVGVRQKGSAATPCEPELIEALIGDADLVLTGTAD